MAENETKERRPQCPAPFAVEADGVQSGDLMIQSINCQVLRGAISPVKGTIVNRGDRNNISVAPVDQVAKLSTIPPLPGQQIHVDPAKRTYTIIDPLHENKELLTRLQRGMVQNFALPRDAVLEGVPPSSGVLDVHRMKTLCRELVNIVEANEGKVVKGTLPDREAVDAMPGEYLLNPGIQARTDQPQFEKDFDAWRDRLSSVVRGGS